MKFRLLLISIFTTAVSFSACKRYDPAGELSTQRRIASYTYLDLDTLSVSGLSLKDIHGDPIFGSQKAAIDIHPSDDSLILSFSRSRLMQYFDYFVADTLVVGKDSLNLTGGKMHSLLVFADSTQALIPLLLEDDFKNKDADTLLGIRLVVQKAATYIGEYPQYYVEARTKYAQIAVKDDKREEGDGNQGEGDEGEGNGGGDGKDEEEKPSGPRYSDWQIVLDFNKDGKSGPIAYQNRFNYFDTQLDKNKFELEHLEIVIRDRSKAKDNFVSQMIFILDPNDTDKLNATLVLTPKPGGNDSPDFKNYNISLFDHQYGAQ